MAAQVAYRVLRCTEKYLLDDRRLSHVVVVLLLVVVVDVVERRAGKPSTAGSLPPLRVDSRFSFSVLARITLIGAAVEKI